jgi:excisionase family DNA binding protein
MNLHDGEVTAEGFYTIKEAMAFLRLSRSSLYALMDEGRLPYAKIGKSRRVPVLALKEFAAKSMVAAR